MLKTKIMRYKYKLIKNQDLGDELIKSMSELFSGHYGIWGSFSDKQGEKIILSKNALRKWVEYSDNYEIILAYIEKKLIGYAIVVSSEFLTLEKNELISWVVQFVVHTDHRYKGVGKTILEKAYNEAPNNFAWGLVSSNPYAVRALERVTKRFCNPSLIEKHSKVLKDFGEKYIPYIDSSADYKLNDELSAINTKFFIDHSTIKEKIESLKNPWTLDIVAEGYEWYAFTFKEQRRVLDFSAK